MKYCFSSDHSMYITRVINYITTRTYFFAKMFNVSEIEVLTKIDFQCIDHISIQYYQSGSKYLCRTGYSCIRDKDI